MKKHPELLHPNNAIEFLTSKEISLNHYMDLIPSATDYNLCHFWSNFEIANLDIFNNDDYENFFQYLDTLGGFYYERWGDAPVHSIGVSLFADKDKIHFFKDIGYDHDPYTNCPNTETTQMCEIGKFSRWEHLYDQNCLMNWLHHDQPKDVY